MMFRKKLLVATSTRDLKKLDIQKVRIDKQKVLEDRIKKASQLRKSLKTRGKKARDKIIKRNQQSAFIIKTASSGRRNIALT